jgi:hypothetical protein
VGPQRLIRLLGAVLLAIVIVACGGAEPLAKPAVPPRPSHLQIVHAMKMPQRRELLDRFRKRNAEGREGADWIVNEEAVAMSLTVIDPFAGFLRRARRSSARTPSGLPRAAPSMPLADEQARAIARGFVRRNADLLGLPRHVVVGLGERVRSVEPGDHASPNATYVVRFDASFSTKGYEAFHEIDNTADVEVFVDDDGQVSSFVNLSRVHPPLLLDTRPRLNQEDARVVAQLLGRSVFAVVDDTRDGEADVRAPKDARDMRRMPLGKVQAEDVLRLQLVIHESAGPELAWLTYRLAYFVEVGKPVPVEMGGGDPLSSPPIFFFRYVVDADTGDVLEDARAPITPSVLPD